jgi:CRISPR-associated protein Cmr2
LIGSIKNARPFEQIAYAPEEFGEAGRKCSVDGERNALFFGAETENENYLAQGICLKNTDKVIVEKNEGLSAVSFLKRFYKRETIEQYLAQSVGEISIKHLQWRQDGDQFIEHDAFREYRSKFSGYFDAQYCFEENLTEENFPDRQKLAQIKNWHALLIRHLIKENKNRHYAVVRFDADNMGKWMTGAYLAGQDLEQFQRKLSELLTVFAQKAKSTILTRYKGATVYAGGDDFIGMVSLHYLLEILNDLRVAFKQEVNDRLVQFFPSLRHEITFSAGVAIAYYKTPLSIVLKEARQMEHLAKNRSDSKDAVAISRLKKSGERQQCCFAFGPIVLEKETGHTRNIWLIRRILEQLKTGFSTAFIRNYQLNFARTGEVFRIECDEIDETELLRLITRSREKQTSISDCRELAANLEPFRRNTDFFKFLNIIDFIHRQTS